MTKNDHVVFVRWTLDGYTGCFSAVWGWEDEVAIGVLEPGMHEVRFFVDDSEVFERKTLIVRDAAPPLRLVPSTVSIAGGDTVRVVHPKESCERPSSVKIDDVAIPVTRRGQCDYVFQVPPRTAGVANVIATFGGEIGTANAALRYVDPAAAPDDSAFERVLVPVLYDGAGAYGSQWKTEGKISFEEPLRLIPNVLAHECANGTCLGSTVDLASFGSHPSGLLLFVPRGMQSIASLSVRETSKGSGGWATPVPIVRERDFVTSGFLRFSNIPFDPAYRATLRVYGLDGISPHGVFLSATGVKSEPGVFLSGPCGRTTSICDSALPAFGSADLHRMFPALVGGAPADIAVEIFTNRSVARYWAFVSVTNNETQQVTIIPPQ